MSANRGFFSFAFLTASSLVLLVSCATAPRPRPSVEPEFFASPDPALKSLPFSEAVRAGDFLFISGQIGNAPGTLTLVPGGVSAESKQVLENIKNVLDRHRCSLDQVVKCTVFLADMQDWPVFNTVYRQYFSTSFPARSALGAHGLALGARVELECIAFAPAAPR